jgi:hypothetical protein
VLSYYLFSLLVFPAVNFLKGEFSGNYVYPSIIFWCALIAGIVGSLFSAKTAKWKKLLFIAVLVATVFYNSMGVAVPASPTYFDMERLNPQIAIADRVSKMLIEKDIRGVQLYENTCDYSTGFLERQSDGMSTFMSLCPYIHPEIEPYIKPYSPKVLLIFVQPIDDKDHTSSKNSNGHGELLDQFDAGMMHIKLYLTTDEERAKEPICSW